MSLAIKIAGEELLLFADRAIYWERKQTLLVADTHWGKAATLRSAAIPVPEGTTRTDMQRLDALLRETSATRMVLLGDAIHAKQGRAPRTMREIADWRDEHARLDILLIRGNHDRRAGDPPADLNIRCANAPYPEPPFVFQHYPGPSSEGYALAGHMHPAIRLTGRGKEKRTLHCYWFTQCCGVLPAFGALTGAALVAREQNDRVYVIADDEVIGV